MKLYVRSTNVYGDVDTFDLADARQLISNSAKNEGFDISPDDIEIYTYGDSNIYIYIYFTTTIHQAIQLANRYASQKYSQYIDQYIQRNGFDPEDRIQYQFIDISMYKYGFEDPEKAIASVFSNKFPAFPDMDRFKYADKSTSMDESKSIYRCVVLFEDNIKRDMKNNRKPTYRSMISELQSEVENGWNSIYEQTEAGSYIDSIAQSVEDSLGIWSEPSIQGGHGSIIFRDKDTDEVLLEKDYEEFCDDIIDMALESKSKKEFMSQLKQYYDI